MANQLMATDEPPTPLDPGRLRPFYSAFLARGDRILLTGHSHQAWPDVALDGMKEAFVDAAAHVDDKWEKAAQVADDIRDAVIERIGGRREDVALGASTHELVTRFLSGLPWKTRKHLVTSDGEFHSIRRQLRRLEEEGIEVTWVAAHPVETLTERAAAAVRDDTAAVLFSTVLFATGHVVPHIEAVVEAAQRVGAEVLLDAYHHVGVQPFDIAALLDPVYVVGGGYKYLQWGEGCCFLRVPPGADMRPVHTGWFADFAHLAAPRTSEVRYGRTNAERFAGSTYDPVSHYRARAVATFFREEGLTVPRLAATYDRQTSRLIAGLDDYEVLTPRSSGQRGGFVAVRIDGADTAVRALRERGVFVDARGDVLRFGPAPYVTHDEIDRAVSMFRSVVPREA